VPYTRVSEYKHLTGQTHTKTTITYEYPRAEGDPYYPVPRPENQALFKKYEALALATPDVTFVGGPASQLSFVVQPSSTKAGAIITPAPAVLVTDQNGNPTTDTSSFSVRMVRTNAGTLSGGTARPLVNGVVTFDMLSVNHLETGAALRAEGPGGLAAESSLFDVTAGDPAQATSTLLASPVNVTLGSTSTLTVTVLDLGANPLSGVTVALSVDGTGNTLGASSGTTDASGVFTTTLGSTVAEAKHVTASAGPLTLTTTVTFIP
jgi:hypothetical protein